MTIPAFDGIPFDPVAFRRYGYLDPVEVGGVVYPRWMALLVAAGRDLGRALNTESVTEVAIGTGSRTFVMTSERPIAVGAWVMIASKAAPATRTMYGQVTANAGGSLTVLVTIAVGEGNTAADWAISISAPLTTLNVDVQAALGAADRAESARDAALVGNDFFADTAAGIDPVTGVAEGETFRVLAGDAKSFTLYRHEAGPVATAIASFATKTLIDEALGELADARQGEASVAANLTAIKAAIAAAARSAGLLTNEPEFTNVAFSSTDATGPGLVTFTAAASGLASIRWLFSALVQTGEKVTVFYRGTQTAGSGTNYIQLRSSGAAQSAGTPGLTLDGKVRAIVLTATGIADRLFWNKNSANGDVVTLHMAVFRGDYAAAVSAEPGLAATLLALGQMFMNTLNGLRDDVTALQASAIAAESWTDEELHPLVPSTMFLRTGARNTLFGRQILRGRKRQTGIDLLLVNRTNTSLPGFTRYTTPQVVFDTDEVVTSTGLVFEVADPSRPTKRFTRAVSVVKAPATVAGVQPILFIGDSKSASYWASLYPTLVSAGMTVQDIGTRAVQVSGVDRYYEGRAGWGVRDYIGKARSDEYGVNPFLKPADAGDLAAHPDLCFADSGTGVRPSYAENPGLGSYSIFSSAHYASELSLSTSAKAILILQLGHNDQTNGAAFLPDVALGHNHIVSDFRATFPNGAVVVVQEGIKSGFGSGGGGFDGLIQWNTVQGPLAELKMELFDGREAERIYLVHAFMHENMDASSLATSVDSTDPITGVVKRTITDIVHQTGQTSREWANAVAPVILHLQATL